MFDVGLLRLARVIEASFKIQKLKLRNAEDITKQHYGIALNKNTIRAYKSASVSSPREFALQKLAPLLFKVEGFTNDDEIGYPRFKEIGTIPFKRTSDNAVLGNPVVKSSQILDDNDIEKNCRSTKVEEMPLSHLRYTDYRDLMAIIDSDNSKIQKKDAPSEDPVKDLLKLYPQLASHH